MKLMRSALVTGVALALAAPAFADDAPGAAVGPNWAAFSAIASAYTDSIEIVTTHEDFKGKQFDMDLEMDYKKPSLARCKVLADRTPGKESDVGAELVWRGGPKIQAHPGGKYKAVVVVLDRTNPRVTDAIGIGCGQTSIDQIRDFWLSHGTVTETPGPAVNGVPTTAETLTPSDVKADFNLTKQVMYLSTATHLPVENLCYSGDKIVLDAKYTEFKINPGLSNDTFTLTETTDIK